MLEERELSEVLDEYMSDYAKGVILDRAIPDIRDGLKPSHRFFLWECYLEKLHPKAKHKKLAGVAGSTLAFHPHANTSIEQAAITISQDWVKSIPLVDIYGNNGSIDGASAAASRYIKARYNSYAELVIGEIDKLKDELLVPNYDNTCLVPKFYPSKFPIIVMNDQLGIALGMSTNILPSNSKEIIDCTIAILQNKPKEEVREIYKGPDFITGGYLLNDKKEIDKIFDYGIGSFTVQSSYELDPKHNQIIITSLPLKATTESAMNSIISLSTKMTNIENVEDLTEDNHHVRIVITCSKAKEEELDKIAKTIISKSILTSKFSANHLMLSKGKPKLLGIYDCLTEWCDFRTEIKTLELQKDLEILNREIEKLTYRALIFEHRDELLNLMLNEKSLKNVKNIFIQYEVMPEELQNLINSTTLTSLSNDNKDAYDELISKLKSKNQSKDRIVDILKDESLIKNEIIKELLEIKKCMIDRKSILVDELYSASSSVINSYKKIPTMSVIGEGMTLLNSSKGDLITDKNCLYVFLKSGSLLKYNSIKLTNLKLMTTPLNRIILKLKADDDILYCCSDQTLPDAILCCSVEGRCKRITKETLQKLAPLSTASSVRQYHKETVEYFTIDDELEYKLNGHLYKIHESNLEKSDSLGSGGRKSRKKVK